MFGAMTESKCNVRDAVWRDDRPKCVSEDGVVLAVIVESGEVC